MSKNTFADGMLVNTFLIAAGVVFLLWLSTLGNSDISAKMEYYGTSAGKFVAMFLFMVPFFAVFIKISQGGLSGKSIAIWMIGMVLVQLIVAAYMPLIVDLYRSTGGAASDLIIKMKG